MSIIYKCVFCGKEYDSKKVPRYKCKDGEICESCVEKFIGKDCRYFYTQQVKYLFDVIAENDSATLKANGLLWCVEDAKHKEEQAAKEEEQRIATEEALKAERARRIEEQKYKINHIMVSTGDIHRDYEIIKVIHYRCIAIDNHYDERFSNCINKLKEEAALAGADAVINIKFDAQEVYVPTFSLGNLMSGEIKQTDMIYGTAVKFI